jgi:hypothetical protein
VGSGAVSLDGGANSNFSVSGAGVDLTLASAAGMVIIQGSEAAANAVYIDADAAALSGLSIATGATSGVAITGGPFDVNVTGAVSLDADLASNFNTAAGDITIDSEAGSVVIVGREAVADAVYIDADANVASGLTIAVGSTNGLNIGGGLTNIGAGTFTTADGDNDLGVDGDLEVNGVTDLDGTLSVAGATTLGADVTLSADTTGGNQLAKNEFVGLPRIMLHSLSTMANGATNTIITDIGDSETPATDWTAINANVTMANSATIFRQGTASLHMLVLDAAVATDGCTNALLSGNQDWSDDEAVGMWFRADRTLAAGDFMLVLSDSVAADVEFPFPAYTTANVWQWIEIDITTANENKDVLDDVNIELSTAGAAHGEFNAYFDFIVKWDVDEEEDLGVELVQDGVLSLVIHDTSAGAAAGVNAVLYQDYFVHYQATGDDAIVIMTDQSDADKLGLALLAYE